jgi:hypothetical protein
LAIQQYDSAKKHFPGALNLVHGTVVGWPITLFSFLGRDDLWSDPSGWRYGYVAGTTATPRVPEFICPDDFADPPAAPIPVSGPLTYVVNVGLYNSPCNNTFMQEGFTSPIVIPTLFLDCSTGTTSSVTLSSVKSPAQTVMLSEKQSVLTTASKDLTPPDLIDARQWWPVPSAKAYSTSLEQLGFTWPNYPPQPAPAPQPESPTTLLQNATVGMFQTMPPAVVKYWAPLPSIHKGVSIVTFCDGHTSALSEDTLCTSVRALP